jgi:hypothetical protein
MRFSCTVISFRLRTLEDSKESPSSFYRPLGRKQGGEEFLSVAQFLGLDAEIVAAAGIELCERSTLLTNSTLSRR